MKAINTGTLPRLIWVFAFVAGAGLAAGTFGSTAFAADATDEWNDMPVPVDDADAVQKGKERFAERCTFCHGGGGRGAKAPCLVCGHFKRGGKNSQVYANIAAGVPGTQMGAFGTTLQQEEINNIIAYMRVEQKKHEAENK
jgi:mono/diheme cytochrome c family protein